MDLTAKKYLYFVAINGKYYDGVGVSHQMQTYQLLAVDANHAVSIADGLFERKFPDYRIAQYDYQRVNIETMKAIVER